MKLKVVELFAGVGGFRLGLEGWKGKSSSSGYKEQLEQNFEVVWSNQWEPSSRIQHANKIYVERWGKEGHCGKDINSIANNDIPDNEVRSKIPEHDLLVGGFPCQDYSVAGVNTNGIQGKKGVLWWNIHRILEVRRPKYLLLENVDRLLKSPTTSRGRDFAILLSTLDQLGYSVEWKVINAADYGMPQRRRRVFILGSHRSSDLNFDTDLDWLHSKSVLANAFPSRSSGPAKQFALDMGLEKISESFEHGKFHNSGVMINGIVVTSDYTPQVTTKSQFSKYQFLKDVLIDDSEIPEEFFVNSKSRLKLPIIKRQLPGTKLSYLDLNDNDEAVLETELDKWKYLKGRKAEKRSSSKGIFHYTEGPLKLADDINAPGRTIITSEGGSGASRFKHLIEIEKGKKYRRLTPKELERMNMFPDDHTQLDGISDSRRAFFMGNALVVGKVERIGISLSNSLRVNNRLIQTMNYNLA